MLYFSLFPLIFLATTNMQVIGNTKYTVTADGNQHQELKDRRFWNVELDPAGKNVLFTANAQTAERQRVTKCSQYEALVPARFVRAASSAIIDDIQNWQFAVLKQVYQKDSLVLFSLLAEMTARFEMTSSIGQRCILQYMLPWLANVELVDLSNSFPTPPELNIETEEEEEETDAMSPVKLEGEGWGSVEATQLVLNNLFYITVKVSATGF